MIARTEQATAEAGKALALYVRQLGSNSSTYRVHMAKAKKFKYVQTCSRCGGSGLDPEIANCTCDCCDDGVETLTLTEEEAKNYPNAERERSGDLGER